MSLTQNKQLAATAKNIVTSKVKEHDSIIAAYTCGSFVRGDMVYGSDVDIGFVIRYKSCTAFVAHDRMWQR